MTKFQQNVKSGVADLKKGIYVVSRNRSTNTMQIAKANKIAPMKSIDDKKKRENRVFSLGVKGLSKQQEVEGEPLFN